MRLVVVLSLVSAMSCSPSHDLPALADASPPADVATVPDYPAGPYSGGVGGTLPDLTFEGYHAGSNEWGPLRVHDYYDPEGRKGIRALVLVSSAVWCPVCAHAADTILPPAWSAFTPRGARFLHVLREGVVGEPSRRDQADKWRLKYIVPFDNGIDPTGQTLTMMPKDEGVGLPTYLIIDPRTMKVVEIFIGDRQDIALPKLDALLARNGAPP